MCRHYDLRQLLYTCPFFFISLCTTNHILQLGAICCKWFQVVHREYLIEALFESLNLDLKTFMEYIMQCQVYVVLQIVQINISVLAIRLEFYLWVAREGEIQGEIFKFHLQVIKC